MPLRSSWLILNMASDTCPFLPDAGIAPVLSGKAAAALNALFTFGLKRNNSQK